MHASHDHLKIAIQKSGRLTKLRLELLTRCGLSFTQSKDQLFCYGQKMPIDVLLVRDDDIPGLVGEDICDLGIAGLNVIEEKRLSGATNGAGPLLKKIRGLDFGHSRLSIAGPEGTGYAGTGVTAAITGKAMLEGHISGEEIGRFLSGE